jgi:hypothetical protein
VFARAPAAKAAITAPAHTEPVSLTTALYGCGRYYPINTPLIEKMASASRRIGEEVAAREGKNWHAILVLSWSAASLK